MIGKKHVSWSMMAVLGLMVFLICSCEQKSVEEKPVPFDAEIDGIAVQPLPRLDAESARAIVRARKDGEGTERGFTELRTPEVSYEASAAPRVSTEPLDVEADTSYSFESEEDTGGFSEPNAF